MFGAQGSRGPRSRVRQGQDALVRVSLKLDRDAGPVVVDRIQIQQVALNLIRNAIDAMADAPRRELEIVVRAEDARTVRISVSDTGSAWTRWCARWCASASRGC